MEGVWLVDVCIVELMVRYGWSDYWIASSET